MFSKNFAFVIVSAMITVSTFAQNRGVQMITTGGTVSFRGMSIPSDNVIWVSGSQGTVGKSVNGGKSFRFFVVPGYEKKDFRDIEAFDSSTAIIMAVDNPAYILKTTNGGATWRKVYEKSENGMFLDAMDFRNSREGICIGDPLVVGGTGRKFWFILRTIDGGETWLPTPMYNMPPASNDEAIFSASGTNVFFLDDDNFDYAFVTGGKVSNLYMVGNLGKPNKVINLPLNQGIESAGTFSLATDRKKKFYCVGGDYKKPAMKYDNFYYSTDGGKKWASPSVAPPYGYRSCIAIIEDKKLVTCGTNGVDYSKDGGKDWISITKEGFNVCMVSPKSKTVFLAGDKGRIGRLVY
jgi:photosystem II stability/assembly factor-like uncharacterized protein